MKLVPVLLTLLALASCASQKAEEKDIETKVSESTVSDPQKLGESIHDLISNSKTLTQAQKDELTKTFAENKNLAAKLSEESYKFRSVLIKELLSGKMNENEVELIKNDIRKIEEQRLKNTFDTVEKITSIVSKHPEKEKFANHLIYMEGRLTR